MSEREAETVVFRDAADVGLLFRQARNGLIQNMIILLLAGCCVYLFLRKPDLVVIDNTSGRVVQINNREYGKTEAVSLQPDAVKDGDKLYLAGQFVALMFTVDPVTRNQDVRKALRLMTPGAAEGYYKFLVETGLLERERAENRHATWTRQEASIDPSDRYKVRFLGLQTTTKSVEGRPVEETKQYDLTIRMMVDPVGRADRNLRSGLQIVAIDFKEVPAVK